MIPVRPRHRDRVPGVRCVASLSELDEPVELVDVFRRFEHARALAREAVAIGAKALRLQPGIVSEAARSLAESARLDWVENACTKVVHRLDLA